jgi:hypothetical protein
MSLTRTQCMRSIKAWFETSFGLELPDAALFATDPEYTAVDVTSIRAVLSDHQGVGVGRLLDPALYSTNFYDCEDYAMASRAIVAHQRRLQDGTLPPPAFGMLSTGMHVLNLGIQNQQGAPSPFLLDVYNQRFLEAQGGNLRGFMDDLIGRNWLLSPNVRLLML